MERSRQNQRRIQRYPFMRKRRWCIPISGYTPGNGIKQEHFRNLTKMPQTRPMTNPHHFADANKMVLFFITDQ